MEQLRIGIDAHMDVDVVGHGLTSTGPAAQVHRLSVECWGLSVPALPALIVWGSVKLQPFFSAIFILASFFFYFKVS